MTVPGSVPRCIANSSVPMMQSAAAAPMPEAGATWVASSVTSAGPMTKMSSSFTDSRANAVCSRRWSDPTSALHRVRTMLPTEGIDAPAMIPVVSSVHSGARSSAHAMNAEELSANTPAWASRIWRWPSRSARWATSGLITA